MSSFLPVDEFRRRLQQGDAAGAGVCCPARVLRLIEEESRLVRFVMSDGSQDRMGDIIDPTGWELAAYRRNPVVLFAHDALAPPIGRSVNVFTTGSQLLGDVQFADPEIYPFADTIFRMVKAGYIKAGSVGFLPLKCKFANDPDRPGGIDFVS